MRGKSRGLRHVLKRQLIELAGKVCILHHLSHTSFLEHPTYDYMAEKLDSEVRYFLRSSEDVRITLETLIIPRDQQDDPQDSKNRRVLAVVTHQNQFGEEEEGRCVFYCPIDAHMSPSGVVADLASDIN